MNKLCCSFLLMILSFAAFSQPVPVELLKNMKARSIGPAGMSGRVTAIDAVHDEPSVIFAGTASGGLWKSTSGGIHWEPVFDKEKVMSIGAVAIQQSNPDVVWVGTGEGNPRNSLNGGYGIYKSLDGGRSWMLMGLEKTRHIHRIVVDPSNPNTVYVAAIGSPWGEHPERGVYKTMDGGKSWEKILYINEKTGAADMVMDPSNPNKILVAMWEHRRKPWTFNSGGPGSGLYMTLDGGESWKQLTADDGLPKGDLGRIGIAIARSNPDRIYALVESSKNALYRSDDGGFNWYKINDRSEIGNRPFYYSEIYVDPMNENRLYSLFTYVNYSEDGGRSFSQLMPAYGTNRGVHPDHHAWWIHPEDPNYMIEGNDGGLNITRDRGKTWRFVENLPLAQFYHINVDNEYPYNVYGGMQDNGSWGGPAYVWKSQGIRNSYWQELSFGDGFDVIPDPDDSRYGYSMSQEGYVSRYDRVTGHNRLIRPTHPVADSLLRFNWNSAIALDPFENSTIYFGSQYVHKSTNKGHSWKIISPDLTTDDPEKQKQHLSGGLTMDATGAENNTTILAITPSPLERGVIWVGTDDGKIQLTRNGGESWTDVTPNVTGMPAAGWVAQIKASEHNAGEAFAVVNNYRNFDYKPYLFRTKDYGLTWTSMVDQSQVWSYTLAFIQDPEVPALMFLGTDGGMYVSIDEGRTWTIWDNGFPHVSTMDLAIHPREHDLVIGTFGRAAYVLDDIRPLRKLAMEGRTILDRELVLFDPPTGYEVLNQQPSGTRFGGDAIYNGENRPTGAMISYFVRFPEKKKEAAAEDPGNKRKRKRDADEEKEEESEKEEVKRDSVLLEIFASSGEKIRTLKRKAPDTTGLHRIFWYLDEKGSDYPSRNEPRNDYEPGGVTVLPGTYGLRMSFGESVDSTTVEVKFDPRVNISSNVLRARQEFARRIEKDQHVAADAMERLRKSKSIAADYEKRLSEIDKEEFEEAISSSKAIQDSINNLMDPIVGKQSDQQGIVSFLEVPVTSRLRNAAGYMQSSLESPGPTEERLLKQAEDQLGDIVARVNAFYNEQWSTYRSAMEALLWNLKTKLIRPELSIFQEVLQGNEVHHFHHDYHPAVMWLCAVSRSDPSAGR